MMTRRAILVGIGLVLSTGWSATSNAGAQSVLATRGLGYPTQPQDARSAGLGGIRLGLPGTYITWGNPAAAVGIPAPGLTFGYQYDNFTADVTENDFEGRSARFPMILAVIPAGERLAFQAGFGSFLDQNWRILESDTLQIGDEEVPVTDWWESTGGVSRLRFAAAASVTSDISVGLGLDVYTGSADRTLGRAFPNEPRPACCSARWNYTGMGLTAGARWSPTDDSGIGVSIAYGGSLATSPQDTAGVASEFDLPLMLEGGASGRVGANTLIAIGGSWTGWSTAEDELADIGGAADTWSARLGVEWDGLTISTRAIPLRLGVRTEKLPFAWNADGGEGSVDERALSLGTGVELAGGGVRPDLYFELGDRGGDAGIDESFWRFGFSVRVLGP